MLSVFGLAASIVYDDVTSKITFFICPADVRSNINQACDES